MYPIEGLCLHPAPECVAPLDKSNPTSHSTVENPLLHPFDSINAKVTTAAAYDEATDVSTTYIGPAQSDPQCAYQLELEFNFDAQSFTTGILPDGKELRILIDTGATWSYLSKSFFDSNPHLHKYP